MRASVVFVALAACAPAGSETPTDAKLTGDGKKLDASGTGGDAGLPISNNVTVIVEPSSTHASELVTAISGAQTSVYMTMYEIDATSVLDALVARAHAGVDVQAILDGSSQTKSFNTPAFNQLSSAGVKVVWSSNSFTYTHEKCVIIDGKHAWVMTMNANNSSMMTNREFLAIDGDPADVAEATAVFQADHTMQTVTPSGALVVANANARAKLVALIDGAKTSLDVEGEEFSDTYSTGVARAVANAAVRGVAVRVVVGNISATMAESQAIALVKQGGARVVITGPTSGNGTASNPYIHAKAIVVDSARAFVGSENFSAGSLGYNRELGVFFDASAEVAKVEAAIAADFARGTPQ